MKDNIIFDWKKVPGDDSKKLLDHLVKCVKLSWAADAEIEKKDEDRTISMRKGKNSATFRLKNAAVLELEDGKTYAYDLKGDAGLRMCNREAVLLLRDLDSGDDEGLEGLAKTVSDRSRKDPQDIVGLLHSEDEDDAYKARSVLLVAGDTVLTPLMDSLKVDVPEPYVWDMKTIVDIQVGSRKKIAALLEKMLGDKREVEMPELPPGTEEKYPPRRVCDEGYLLLRDLLALEETEEERFFNADAYFHMEYAERDTEINRLKTSKKWVSLTEQS
jgi:hypothetical protein